ncbi:hypothetical protein COV13_02230 [Candidatus Woesearchaeota archaeon CG10_big_fil_rev_8_21_14_0_10_32_9]|nr:MAG: hypothetical protein COV13_02230 [Candidatus Woesearchaeota archaeon CG10_big_fil_rev_8_21_14_0_10_32_9]
MNLLKHAWKSAFTFSDQELKNFFFIVVFSGFILSFRRWGTDSFDSSAGLINFIVFSLIFLIIYSLFIAAQKFLAGYLGYDCKYSLWHFGPAIGIFLTFVSYGWIPFLYLGSIDLKENMRLRLGTYRPYVHIKDLMWVGIAGPLMLLLLLIIILQPLYFLTQSTLVLDFIMSISWILIFTSLPLPKTNGINVLLYSRKVWSFYFFFSLLTFFLVRSMNIYAYVIVAVIALLLVWVVKKFITDKYL